MDDDRVDVSVHGNSARGALGLRSAWLGRILGLGSRGERVLAAVAYGNGVPALRDDAGKARNDEGVERVACVLHVFTVHSRNPSDSQWRREFGPCVRAI